MRVGAGLRPLPAGRVDTAETVGRLVALDTVLPVLSQDHVNAKRLAAGLAEISGFDCSADSVQTNLVYFGLPLDVPARSFAERLRERGVKLNSLGESRVRAVTHRMVEAEDIDRTLDAIRDVVEEMRA